MSKKNKKNKQNNGNQSQSNYQHQPVVEIGGDKSAATSVGNNQAQAQPAPAKDASMPKGKGAKITSIVVGILIVVAIILGITLGGGDSTSEEGDVMTREEKRAERRAEREEEVAMEAKEEMVAQFGTQAMEPIVDGEYTYRFDGVDWIFEANDEEGVGVPITRVNMMFKNFTRYEGALPVAFGNPYKFGIYEGVCSEVDGIAYDQSVETGIPLGFVECVSANATTNIFLFQEGSDVVVKMHKSTDEVAELTTVTSIDLTTVVQ